MFGQLEVVRERLAALLGVVDTAIAQPGLWPRLGLRRVGQRHWTRDAPNPFVALGSGPAGPALVRPINHPINHPSDGGESLETQSCANTERAAQNDGTLSRVRRDRSAHLHCPIPPVPQPLLFALRGREPGGADLQLFRSSITQ